MKLKIDNMDRSGLREYTRWLDAEHPPKIVRKLNRGSEIEFWLVCEAGQLVVPRAGARVFLQRDDGTLLFSGYMPGAAEREFAGYGVAGAVLRYRVSARGEELRLDRKILPLRPIAVSGSARELLKAITRDACDGIDTTGVQETGELGPTMFGREARWSDSASQIAASARASWRVESDAVTLTPIGSNVYTLSEADPTFAADGLMLKQSGDIVNDITIEGGESEPEMYVKDYFVGDGHTLRFPMSMRPFLRSSETLLEEEYPGGELLPQRWIVVDDNGTVGVSDGKLRISGAPQAIGRASVCLTERLELGGGLVLEHGAVTVSGDGVLGGIYAHPLGASGDGADLLSDCIAGFTVSSQGDVLRAVISGAAIGPTMAMQAGHRYVLRTRVFCAEAYRVGQLYRSSSGEHRAAGAESQSVRFVLEVQDINSGDPASQVQEALVLYDGVVANTPALAIYAIVNGARLSGEVSYTRLRRTGVAEVRVRSADGATSSTRSVGMLADGAQCSITGEPAVYFYSPYKPNTDEQIVVRYRSSRQSGCRVRDEESIGERVGFGDDGVRAATCRVMYPRPRTSEDCEAAALALLDDVVKTAWGGEYVTWSDFLPQAAKDLYPGDVLQIDVADVGESVSATLREVEIEMVDGANDRGRYALKFANDAAESIAVQVSGSKLRSAGSAGNDGAGLLGAPSQAVSRAALGPKVSPLPDAEVVSITSDSVTIDAGVNPPQGGGFEVRSAGDWGWGTVTDSNLQGRFTTRQFTLPKNERGQDYFLRMYDGATPPNYSVCTTLLHVDVKQ